MLKILGAQMIPHNPDAMWALIALAGIVVLLLVMLSQPPK